MNNAARLSLVLSATVLLAGCGQYLGAYTVEAVQVVTEAPMSFHGEASSSYNQYLEIRLASKTSLTAIGSKVDAVYVDADFCPLRNPDGLIAFGPFSDDRQDLSLPSNAPALRLAKDGRYRYRIYVVIAYKAQLATKPGQMQSPTYDLRPANRDLCLRLFAPGYNLIKSRSDTIRVPADMISSALKSMSAPKSHAISSS